MDNDFRSLELKKPLRGWSGIVYRDLRWSRLLQKNQDWVRRPADPNLNEIQYGSHVIRHPLKIDGVVYRQPDGIFLLWGKSGCFRGVKSYSGLSEEHLLILIDYAEKYMGLHNFDFWKVVNNG